MNKVSILKQKPHAFRALTGITVEEFEKGVNDGKSLAKTLREKCP